MDNSNSDEQKPKSILKKRTTPAKKPKPKVPPAAKKKAAGAHKYTICKSKSKLYKNVQKIQIFNCELEKVEQFKGINKVIETYPLLKGKNQQAAMISSEMIQCHFKVNIGI